MTDTVVARRYADAIFALGRKEGEDALDRHGACLASLGEMLELSPALDMTLKSPVVSVAEKKAVLERLLDRLDAGKIMRNFCFLLADKERLACLGHIARWYGVLLDARRGVHRGRVTTAVPLSSKKRARLTAELQKKCEGEMALTFTVDPDILGGMVLTIGDRVLDSSLRAQLGTLRETFKRGV